MRKLVITTVCATLLSGAAFAQANSGRTLTTLPENGVTVTDYYKQDVYDPADNKIGTIQDVIVDNSGQIKALIIAVGGFLGMGEKDVAAPFHAVKALQKDNKWRLVMNASKDELKNAPGFKYDRSSTKWVPDTNKG
jgi:sporulation protein YlmC with PRC-barrel domain